MKCKMIKILGGGGDYLINICVASAKSSMGRFIKETLMLGKKNAQKSNDQVSFHEL